MLVYSELFKKSWQICGTFKQNENCSDFATTFFSLNYLEKKIIKIKKA